MMMSCLSKNMLSLLLVSSIILAMDSCWSTTSAMGSKAEGQGKHVDNIEMYRTWHVHAVNGLSNNKILLVHCKSRDNDIGIHNVTVGNEIAWKFKPAVFGKTLFWCYMAYDDFHAEFDVFWIDEGLFYRCSWKNCIWIGKSNGVYLRNVPENYDEFRHEWKLGRLDEQTNSTM